MAKPREFDSWIEAVSASREAERILLAQVDGRVALVYPSGSIDYLED
jgi:hypothetical protein